MHIAISFLIANLKAIRSLKVLGHCLPITWFVGVVLAIGNVLEVRPQWSTTANVCYSTSDTVEEGNQPDYIYSITMTACLAVCIICYLGSILIVLRSSAGEVVQRRVRLRMGCYVVVGLFSNSCTWAYFMFNVDPGEPTSPIQYSRFFAYFGLNLSGLLNVFLYAYQSRHMRIHRQQPKSNKNGSFNVRFREAASVASASVEVCSSSLDAEPDNKICVQDAGEGDVDAYFSGGFISRLV